MLEPVGGRVPFADVVTPPDRRDTYRRLGWWDDTTLAGQVGGHAATMPDRVAVVDHHGRRTWGELAADAASLAAWLAGVGVGPGGCVSVQLPNWYEFVVAAVAVQSVGAVINPLLPNYRANELRTVFSTARPDVIITPAEYRGCDHPALADEVRNATGTTTRCLVVGGNPRRGHSSFEEAVRSARTDRLGEGQAGEVSEVIFTSGTEARPKAIMHTEQTANFSVRVARSDLGVTAGDVVWMPSPLGHSTGFNYGMRFALYHGLTLVLQDRWDPDSAAALVEAEGCSYTLAATTFLKDLVAAAARRQTPLASLRIFGCGGAPVPAALVDEAAEWGVQVLRLYGSTEVLVATWNRPGGPEGPRRNSDGCALSHVEVQARGDDGAPAPMDTAGELYVRGPNTCVGFYDDRERTAQTFSEDGWVRSGDMVSIDASGYVSVVGRRKEILIRGGINIAPREVEEMLTDFGEVSQAAVIGLPDERLGERMCACVVLAPGATLDLQTVVARLRERGLATYKLPERLEICDGLPMTASGKVQKHELLRVLAATGS